MIFFVTKRFIKMYFQNFSMFYFFTVVNVHFSFSLGHSKGIHKVIGTWNTEETLACTRGGGGGYRGVLTSVDATAFVSKKRFLGNNISCCECTTNNQTSLVFLCIMYSIYIDLYLYMYIHISILEKEIAAGPLRPHQRHALRSHADRAPRPLVRYESTTFHIQSCPIYIYFKQIWRAAPRGVSCITWPVSGAREVWLTVSGGRSTRLLVCAHMHWSLVGRDVQRVICFEICKKSLRLPAAQKRTERWSTWSGGPQQRESVYTGGENAGNVK